MSEETTDAAGAEETPKTAEKGFGDTLRAVFWAALLAICIRSFIVEPFKIPSGSMIPTLLVGDYVLVNKFAYGLRLPITGTQLFPVGTPKRGDVVVFRYPDDPRQDFIKRVIGLPGDRIEMRDGRLFVNAQPIDQISEGEFEYISLRNLQKQSTRRFLERNLDGREYTVIRLADDRRPRGPSGPWIVPEDRYFMMGDNRDNSADSRRWRNSYVSPDQLKGRAFMLHWSWVVASGPQPERSFIGDMLFTLKQVFTLQVEKVRWDRIGRSVDGPAD